MDAPLFCPRCGVPLRVPRGTDAGASHYICPRCLAAVPKPDHEVVPSGVTQRPESVAQPPQAEGIGPHGASPLREGRQPSNDGVGADIRLAQRGVGATSGTVLLAVLGGLTLFYLLLVMGSWVASKPDMLPGMVAPLVFVFVFVLAVVAFLYFRRPQLERSLGEAVVHTLAMVGALVAVLVAFLILVIAACLAGCKGY
jgi:hypothetical protein